MKFIRKIYFILSLLFATAYVSFAQVQTNLVTVKLENTYIKVKEGNELKVILNAAIEDGFHINSNKPNDDFLIPTVVTAEGESYELVGIKYPEAIEINLAFSDKPVSVYEGEIKFELLFIAGKKLKAGKNSIIITLNYQACDDQTCLSPTTISTSFEVEVIAERNNDVKSKAPKTEDERSVSISENLEDEQSKKEAEPLQKAISEQTNQTQIKEAEKIDSIQFRNVNEKNSIASTLESSGLLISLIFIFLAGLALNLTPCVYPLIPITVGFFGGQSEGNTSRLLLMGIIYVLGMSLTYSVIGVVTSLSGAVFGTLLQNPIVIIGIVLLFIALSLSQFGVYEFKMPDKLVMKTGGAKGGVYGAFFMGLTMGIVAAPCIGPFVLGLITYVAAKGDPFYGFLMFFVLALGLGFPYLFLAIFSGSIKMLPRAGNWMEGVKHIFGFLLLGMAFYFIDPILPKSIQGYALPIFGVIAAVILLFFDKTADRAKGYKIFKIGFSGLVLVVSIYALVPREKLESDWQKFSIVNYEQSLNNNERMIVDFYADWCIPCKELDKRTFSDRSVISELEQFSCYKVDMTKTTDENEELRKKFGVVGMPTVLIIDSNGKEKNRLTGFVKVDQFLKLVKKVN